MMQAILGSLSHSSHPYLYASAYTLVPEFEPKQSLSSKFKNSKKKEEIKFGGVCIFFLGTKGENTEKGEERKI